MNREKIILACDLDNTLIHSYKKRVPGDLCIEWIHEKEQGYTMQQAYDEIGKLQEELMLIPVTTRSIEQYLRIQWKADAVPSYAVTTNGAILLKTDTADGVTQEAAWLQESREIADQYRPEMERLLAELLAEGDYIRCRMVDDMYIFSYCKEGVDPKEKVRMHAEGTSLEVIASGKKIYYFPPAFHKGEAVKRLRQRFSPELLISAGDSSIDIPMLEEADHAFCKSEIYDLVRNEHKTLFTDEVDLIGKIKELVKAGRNK